MVKCPRGTPSQIKANLTNLKLLDKLSFETDLSVNINDEKENQQLDSSEEFELDSFKTEKEGWTSQDELVQIFIENMLNILVKSWDGKPCYRPKLKRVVSTPSQSECYGESDLLACEYPSTPSTTADYVNNLYKKRSSTLEKLNEMQKQSDSESEEFDRSAEGEIGHFELPDTFKMETNEEVEVVFLNGASYKGRVSRKLMEGEGNYFWEDGTSYKGKFVDGWATGQGLLEFPSQSVYEGEVYKGFRHGEGMHCLYDSPVMYSGQWWLGQKHGEGMIVYNEPSKGHNFYRGQWQDGVQEGFGYRQYPSGAKYIGFWSNGKRHGRGVMLWSNNDIYRGYWKEGIMHGYGEYTWNGHTNKTLSYPATNTYRGYWSEGKRHGRGIFETINDGIIDTVWDKDMKNGPGTVICANGTVITAENLFYKDKQAPINVDDDSPGLLFRDKVQRGEFQFNPNDKNLAKIKFVSIPIHLSICSINISHQMQKYRRQVEKLLEDLKLQPMLPLKSLNKSTESLYKELQNENLCEASIENKAGFSERAVEEEKYLRQAINSKIQILKEIYNAYSSLACDKPPPFKCLLLRLFLWQMLIDCNIPDSNLTLVDIDDILANEDYLLIRSTHDPFEPIRLGQFILILLTLSWHLYARHLFSENPLVHEERVMKFLENYSKSDCKYVLKMAFNYFVENDLLTGYAKGNWSKVGDEKPFTEGDLAPMEAMYAVYREFGEPLSIRVFLEKMLLPKGGKNENETFDSGNTNNCGNVSKQLANGKNILTVAGEVTYLPGPAPFNFPEIMDADCDSGNSLSDAELFSFEDLSVRNIMNCLERSCSGLYSEGFLINMDYKLTFLEFYNAVISCIELNLILSKAKAIKRELIEERKRKMKEFEKFASKEKLKENRSVSNKRSRQVIDTSKTGKK